METFTAKLIFGGCKEGKSKQDKEYKMISFIRLRRTFAGNELYPADATSFVDKIPEEVKALTYGDVCEVEFSREDALDDRPRFLRLVRVLMSSPYIENGEIVY